MRSSLLRATQLLFIIAFASDALGAFTEPGLTVVGAGGKVRCATIPWHWPDLPKVYPVKGTLAVIENNCSPIPANVSVLFVHAVQRSSWFVGEAACTVDDLVLNATLAGARAVVLRSSFENYDPGPWFEALDFNSKNAGGHVEIPVCLVSYDQLLEPAERFQGATVAMDYEGNNWVELLNNGTMYAYQVLSVIGFFLSTVVAALALKRDPHCFRTVKGGSISCITMAGVTRVLYFAIDPHRYFQSCGFFPASMCAGHRITRSFC
jgi:hypothetical protein